MAIDTVNKRRNVTGISLRVIMALTPLAGLDDDDRENATGAYIGFSYAEAVIVARARGRPRTSVSVSCGVC